MNWNDITELGVSHCLASVIPLDLLGKVFTLTVITSFELYFSMTTPLDFRVWGEHLFCRRYMSRVTDNNSVQTLLHERQ
jgi:hypothetical protein